MQDIRIVPLSKNDLQGSLNLIHEVFSKFTEEEDPDVWFPVSLEPEKHTELLKESNVTDVRYFVALNKDDKVIGTTGLYHNSSDPKDTVWLGWYCVDPKYRGKGVGKTILQWTINRARKEGNSLLRLYTLPNPGLDIAQLIYDKFGFLVTETEERNGEKIVYRHLKL